jgi:hypothetical protein
MEIISKSEAQKRAAVLREIPDSIIQAVNAAIAEGYAQGCKGVIYSRPQGMERITWTALADSIGSKGYTVKSEASQHDGDWLTITL